MLKSQRDFQKVEKLRASHGGKSITELLEMAKVTPSSYYRGKKEAEAAKPKAVKKLGRKRRIKHAVLPAPVAEVKATTDHRMVFLMGTPDQIRAVLAGGAL